MKKPEWLHFELPKERVFFKVKKRLKSLSLHTVCENARCPNIGDCFAQKTATFLLMGNICTRSCKFCAIESGKPHPLDYNEPERIALMSKELGLQYVVLTSVTRDDLQDGGADHYKRTIEKLRKEIEGVLIEILIPDFKGDRKALNTIIESPPDVLNHNIEVPESLYEKIGRPKSFYRMSINVLEFFSKRNLITKSGIMVGLGETKEDLKKTMDDLVEAGVKILTIGQYLQPTRKHLPVQRYYHPDEFEELKETGYRAGFEVVISAPLVRSSYKAKEAYFKVRNEIFSLQ